MLAAWPLLHVIRLLQRENKSWVGRDCGRFQELKQRDSAQF